MKYSDFIQLREYFHPVFNLQNEAQGYWEQFVPTPQFYNLLGSALDAVDSSVPAKRKSIWVQGTFGTGKSHAGSVIRHLFCDRISEIESYINDHVENAEFAARLRKVREAKQFFPVVLSGVQGAYSPRTFALTVERSIKEALRNAGTETRQIAVPSDFERAIEFLNTVPIKLEEILPHAPELRTIAKTKEDIIKKLEANDIDLFLALEETLAKYNISLSAGKLTTWLSEIEAELKAKNIADGLFIFWDEFTSVMDTISSSLINMIQNIAELSEKQNIFLYLISHRHTSSYGGERGDDVRKMNDRFHIIPYKMEANTTYRLMSATIQRKDDNAYREARGNKIEKYEKLIPYLADGGIESSKKDIENLFPLHPYTAFLCSAISGQIGSANRSVFRFLYDEKGFLGFLRETEVREQGGLLTAEALWDFFMEEFSSDKYSAINGTYATHVETLKNKGDIYVKIFKGILLLNALRNTFEKQQVIPSEDNILFLFIGEITRTQITEVLDYLNQKQIIQKDPSNNFIISVSALPPVEIERERNNQRSLYSDAVKVLDFYENTKKEIEKIFTDTLIRKSVIIHCPCSVDETRIVNSLKKEFQEKNALHLILFFAKNEEEKQGMSNLLGKLSQVHKSFIFILFSEILDHDQLQYDRFIGYVATAQVAQRHTNNEQAQANKENAKRIITNWEGRLKNGTIMLYFGELTHQITAGTVAKYINEQVGHLVFSAGADSLVTVRTKPMTFWKTQAAKRAAESILSSQTRDEVIEKFTGTYEPAKFLFKSEDGDFIVDDALELKPNEPEKHPLVRVRKKVEELLEKARKDHTSAFALGPILAPLAEAPFGLYPNIPNFVLLSFALKPYLSELYDDEMGLQLTAESLKEKIAAIFEFWDSGKSGKFRVRFGSREEKKLISLLVEMFALKDISEIPELSSIKNIRWGLLWYCKTKAKRPLWCLKYCESVKEDLQKIVEKIVYILNTQDIPTQDSIRLLTKELEEVAYEFRTLLNEKDSFENGFKNFVRSTENVKIEDSWWDELDTYLNQKINSEIGNWDEDKVKVRILEFYIGKTKKPEPPSAPNNFTVTEKGTDFVSLQWEHSSTPESSYEIRALPPFSEQPIVIRENNQKITKLSPNTEYTFRIRAVFKELPSADVELVIKTDLPKVLQPDIKKRIENASPQKLKQTLHCILERFPDTATIINENL